MNAPSQESLGTTALHWAARRGQLELMAFLLERGAAPDRVGYKFARSGHTPLQLAREQGRDDAVALLQHRGAHG